MAEALKMVIGIFNAIGGESIRYGPGPVQSNLHRILEMNSLEVLWPLECPCCDHSWDDNCPHVIYTFTGPVYMER